MNGEDCLAIAEKLSYEVSVLKKNEDDMIGHATLPISRSLRKGQNMPYSVSWSSS